MSSRSHGQFAYTQHISGGPLLSGEPERRSVRLHVYHLTNIRARKSLPGRSLLRLAIQKRRTHTHPTFVASMASGSRRLLVVCRGDVSWEGGGGRPYYSSVVSHTGGLAGRLRRGSRGTCSGERVGRCCCIGGCMLSSVMRGSKAPGSKYLPRTTIRFSVRRTRGSSKNFLSQPGCIIPVWRLRAGNGISANRWSRRA